MNGMTFLLLIFNLVLFCLQGRVIISKTGSAEFGGGSIGRGGNENGGIFNPQGPFSTTLLERLKSECGYLRGTNCYICRSEIVGVICPAECGQCRQESPAATSGGGGTGTRGDPLLPIQINGAGGGAENTGFGALMGEGGYKVPPGLRIPASPRATFGSSPALLDELLSAKASALLGDHQKGVSSAADVLSESQLLPDRHQLPVGIVQLPSGQLVREPDGIGGGIDNRNNNIDGVEF